MGVAVKINAANTGASTINVNSLGTKAIVDSKGNALTAGKLRINGTNFVLIGEAIEGSGSKLDADLLDGKEATAFATATQGIKADNAVTQTSYNTHLSDITQHKQAYSVNQLGSYSNAEGFYTEAVGDYSHAEGYRTTSSATSSHAEGFCTTASDGASHAEGCETIASGYCSHAEGYESKARGKSSHAEGFYTTANGVGSHSEGYCTLACAGEVYTITEFNNTNKTITLNKVSGLSAGDSLYIKIINSDTINNVLISEINELIVTLNTVSNITSNWRYVVKYSDSLFNNSHAEGSDSIASGYSSHEDYILGVVSVNPSVIGDNYADDWSGKYVTDEWGRIQYHNVVVPATYRTVHHAAVYEENTDKIITDTYDEEVVINEERTDYVPKINPDWDSSKEYISREKRKEWSAVGMIGKLLVRDDGTCQVNGFCKPNDAGIATTAITGYRVMKRVCENIVQILIK